MSILGIVCNEINSNTIILAYANCIKAAEAFNINAPIRIDYRADESGK